MGDPKLVELLDGILLGPYRWRSEWREVVERRELGQEEVKESDSSTATTSRQATRCSSNEARNPSVKLELKRGRCWQWHRYRSFTVQSWNRLAASPVRLGSSKVARIPIPMLRKTIIP